jgi:acyl-CoA thioester hydrolase
MSDRPLPQSRDAYRSYMRLTTRWMDNDAYGHLNNVVYYSLFDTAVNGYLIGAGASTSSAATSSGWWSRRSATTSRRSSSRPPSRPARASRIGRSSVRYEIGLFAEGERSARARGHFVTSSRPRPRRPSRCRL